MLLNEITMYNNNYYEVPYLAHHGILGMKWGVRRYQNEDGTLTEKGKKKAKKILNSEKKADLETRKAKMIGLYNATNNARYSNKLFRASRDYKDKSKAFTDKSKYEKKKGNLSKADKFKNKADKYAAKSKEYGEKGANFYTEAVISSMYLRDISSGKMKAGKDFITQIDFNYYPLFTQSGVKSDKLFFDVDAKIIPVKNK